MAGDQVGGADDEHQIGGQVLYYLVNGLEIGDVVVSEVLALLGGHRLAQFFMTIDRAMQEDYRQIFVMPFDVQFLRVFNQCLLIEFDQG